MHGLTGGDWKRSTSATATGAAQPIGKPTAMKTPGPTGGNRHRASPRPYMFSLFTTANHYSSDVHNFWNYRGYLHAMRVRGYLQFCVAGR
ncbi:hypothetical protein GCM10009780_69130 [Actinomadura alba]